MAILIALAVLFSPSGAGAKAPDRTLEFGDSVQGRDLEAYRIGPRDAERTVLVVGSIHGDEDEGHEIVSELRNAGSNRTAIWLVKTVNPDGIAASARKNARGVDLNRNFPVGWQANSDTSSGYYPGSKPFSEPESRAVRSLVKRIQPDITVWYHQPWNQLLGSCRGPDRLQRTYAKRVGMEFACRGGDLPGTATKWQTRGQRRAFVVELAAGELSSSAAERHARAVLAMARPGGSGREDAEAARIHRPEIKRDPIPYGSDRKRHADPNGNESTEHGYRTLWATSTRFRMQDALRVRSATP